MTTQPMSSTMEPSTDQASWRSELLEILETVTASIEGGVLVVNPESHALYHNQQFLDIWQIPAEIAHDNQAMMRYVLSQLKDPDQFVNKILDVNSDPTAVFLDRVILKDGRVIKRFSQPSNRETRADIHRVWCFYDVTEQIQAEEELHRKQEQIIQMQQAALAELSTPLIPISDDVLVMPLIGSVDSNRAQQILETLLDGVSERRPRIVIIDVTGVIVVDTQVANALLQAAQAVRLLGARVALTGIRPNVAQTLVTLGVSFQGLTTHGSLQDAIFATLQTGR